MGKFQRREIIGVKAFQFKLKSVLEMRVRQLEQVQQRFALQQQHVFQIQQQLQECRDVLQEQLKVSQESVIDPVISQQRFRYIQHLKLQIQHLGELVHRENQVLDKIREEMRQAHIRKKSLELLEEKQRKAYNTHIESQQEKELEDIVLARMSRT